MSRRIYIPKDAAALSMGADKVAAALDAALEDVTIIRTGSRGMLWLEPLVEVEQDDGTRIAWGPVFPHMVSDLIIHGFPENQNHDLCLGPVEELDWLRRQERLTFARCGITDPHDLAAYETLDGFAGIKRALGLMPESVCAEITDSGLRGRGGAGFPAGIKWNTVRQAAGDQKYICCNADEGDSATFADRMLMEGDPFQLIEGMMIAGYATGADKGFIYIRSEYPHAIASMNQAIDAARQAEWLGKPLGDHGFVFDIETRVGAGAYICGEETAMLESIEGKRGMVRAKPPLPALEGLFGKPTVINNVLTLAATTTVMAKGADYYKDYGAGRSTGTQPFQLAGNVLRGGLIEKAFGVSLKELVMDFGGGSRTGRPVRAAQTGGPLGAWIPADKFDVAMTYEDMAEAEAMLGHGGITVADDSVDMAAMARFAMEFCRKESCGKCTPCRIGSQRGMEVIDRITAGEDRQENRDLLDDLCELMRDGSLCAMGGLTPMPVESALKHFPEDFGLQQDDDAQEPVHALHA